MSSDAPNATIRAGAYLLPEDELEGLADFLRDCPGRICGARVDGPGMSAAVEEGLRALLPEFRFVSAPLPLPSHSGVAVASARRASDAADSIFVIAVDGRDAFADEAAARAWFESLNFQREALASGVGRTLFFVDAANWSWLVTVADDLASWIRTFDFEAARPVFVPGISEHAPSARMEIDATTATDANELWVLRNQSLRAIEAGIEAESLLENYLLRWADAALLCGDFVSAEEALSLARTALAQLPATADGHATSQTAEHVRGLFYLMLGEVAMARGDLGQALSEYEVAQQIAERLAEQEPDNAEWQRDLAGLYHNCGLAYESAGEVGKAQTSFESALKVLKTMKVRGMRFSPNDLRWLAGLQSKIGK